jgi:peptide-methionine (S)-S-oxide reductase
VTWSFRQPLAVAILSLTATAACERARAADSPMLPPAQVDVGSVAGAPADTAVFAGGCFWGVQAVFQRVHGVQAAVSGYAGGRGENPSYEAVSTGTTGYAESVQVIYDPAVVSYGQLLRVFFAVAHDPTELNRQGPDVGTQYRSAIFFTSPEQQRAAKAYIAQLEQAHLFDHKIVTQVSALAQFHRAEAYHQDYYDLHPDSPYIVYNDRPKVEQLKRQFPDMYREYSAPRGAPE